MSRPELKCPNCMADDVRMSEITSDGVTLHKCGECALVYIDAANLARVMAKHGLPGPDAPGSADDGGLLTTTSCAECESSSITQMRGGPADEPRTYDLCDDCKGIHFESEWGDDFAGVLDIRDLGEILKTCAGK